MAKTWYLDTPDLIYRMRAGLGSGWQAGQPVPPDAYRFLDDLTAGNERLVTNSLILDELTRGGHADGALIQSWLLRQPAGRIEVHTLSADEFALYNRHDGGEKSLVELTSKNIPFIPLTHPMPTAVNEFDPTKRHVLNGDGPPRVWSTNRVSG